MVKILITIEYRELYVIIQYIFILFKYLFVIRNITKYMKSFGILNIFLQ